MIEKYTLALELDPVWKPEGTFSGLSRARLLPGEGVVVRLPLAYTGSGQPVSGRSVASPALRKTLVGVLAAGIVFLYFRFRSRETALGRFARLAPAEAIDDAWLGENLLSLQPEEAGALWDEKIGGPEVAGVLARLSAERKIETRVEGKKLSMRLLVPIDRLQGYDRDLLQGFFFGGRKETDTDAIRAHYKASGFDPVAKLKPGLEKKLEAHADFRDRADKPAGWPIAVLLLSGMALMALSVLKGAEEVGTVIGIVILHGVLYGLGAIGAYVFQKRIDRLDVFSPIVLWVPALLLYFAWQGARGPGQASPLLLVGLLLLRLGIVYGIFRVAMTKNGPKRIARRKSLASARTFFAKELSRPAPRLKDEWFPYVVAFGLAGDADRWFRTHGSSAAVTSMGGRSGSSSSSSSSSSGGGWTGGGGAFGGAGASGTWAVAAGALAAGVSAPSSSSGGGGGGGGGGGSSGGGGGGGW
jgi:uncharacterized membrane protein YgcG